MVKPRDDLSGPYEIRSVRIIWLAASHSPFSVLFWIPYAGCQPVEAMCGALVGVSFGSGLGAVENPPSGGVGRVSDRVCGEDGGGAFVRGGRFRPGRRCRCRFRALGRGGEGGRGLSGCARRRPLLRGGAPGRACLASAAHLFRSQKRHTAGVMFSWSFYKKMLHQ